MNSCREETIFRHDHIETLAHERNKIEAKQKRCRARGESDIAAAAQHAQTHLQMRGYGFIVPRDLFSAQSAARQLLIEIHPRSGAGLTIDKAQLRPRQIAD